MADLNNSENLLFLPETSMTKELHLHITQLVNK
jgi:hypothetical protein